MRWRSRDATILDPCAGDGEAVFALRELWSRQVSGPEERSFRTRMRVVACEMEESRARKLEKDAELGDSVFCADAFRLHRSSGEESGAEVLFLNPPYDHDREHGRLEHRFLLRFTEALRPGSGVLFFLVPHRALSASAEHLARHFRQIRAWRLPDPDFQAFSQVLLVGVRALRPLAAGGSAAEEIRAWAAAGAGLPVLPEVCPEPIAIEPGEAEWLSFEKTALDLPRALAAYRPPLHLPRGFPTGVGELLGARFQTAMPPRAAHIALALAAGMFNGHRLEPDEPGRFPALLAKGVFLKEPVEVQKKRNAKGEEVGSVQVERPRLQLTVLRLDTYEFHQLAIGTRPTGREDPARWNAADLLLRYGRALARLLGSQFPPLHAPLDPAHRIRLPRLARKPYRVQAEAIRTALKLLAAGRNPFFVAEVGTGKSTMALSVAGALAPEHREATLSELARAGHPTDRLPTVRRTLIVAPPHLLQSWRDQAAAVLPEARVKVLETMADLETEAEIFVLSRERAKLGHGVRGVGGRCPRCGEGLPKDAETNARRRLRCKAVRWRPANASARVADQLAAALVSAGPHPLLESLVDARILGRVRSEGLLHRSRLGDVHARLLAEILRDPGAAHHALASALVALARTLGLEEETLRRLEEPWSETSPHHAPWPVRSARLELERGVPETFSARPALFHALETLYEAGGWEESEPCGEPLFQATPEPRRYPLARRILRKHRRRFDLVVVD